jgi:putative Holliday junction resolvase
MSRILAIDYGKKRTGLAVTDELQIVPGALDTVDTHTLFDYLEKYIQRESVERIIIGEPKQSNGMPSENMARVKSFESRWRNAHPEIPIEGYDERFTSVMAHQTMIDAGLSKSKRQDKELVDTSAATIILQSYMESKNNSTNQQSTIQQ